MIIQQDYTKLGLMNTLSEKQKALSSEDYGDNLVAVLKNLNCDLYYIRNVITSLLWTNINDKCVYHTPLHVLFMLSFAQNNNIELEDWEVLALYYHDAIYKPESKKNETNSIQYMFSMLSDTGIQKDALTKAAFAIQSTAMHLEDYVGESALKIMDLDMSMFAIDTPYFLTLCDGIELEYSRPNEPNFKGYTTEEYLNGRIEFLNKLKNKKNIFRTTEFAKFEIQAKLNIDTTLNMCEKRLKSI